MSSLGPCLIGLDFSLDLQQRHLKDFSSTVQQTDMLEVDSAQMIPDGLHLFSFVIWGITYSAAKVFHTHNGTKKRPCILDQNE